MADIGTIGAGPGFAVAIAHDMTRVCVVDLAARFWGIRPSRRVRTYVIREVGR